MDRAKLQRVVAANAHFTPTRKMSLYSNFARLEELNPDGYEANIAAWREVLEDALGAGVFGDATCIDAGPELVKGLNDRENGMPLALNSVFDRMVADGTLIPLQWFEQEYPATPPAGVAARALRLLGRVAGWVARPQWRSGGAEELRHEKYVDMAAVARAARRITQHLTDAATQEGHSRLAQVASVRDVAALAPELSTTDVDCALAYAAAAGELYFDKARDAVKLRRAGAITDTDANIVSLRAQIRELEAREARLSAEIDEFTAGARRAVKTNRKAAKQLLQRKAIAEKSYERTAGLLDQLQTVLRKIDDASDNQQAVAALETSARVLAEMNQATSVDDVDAVMESLHDEIEQTDAVSQSLADLRLGPDAAAAELDELEIDNELGEMEADAQARQLADSFERLPSVPQHRPGAANESARESESAKESAAKEPASREDASGEVAPGGAKEPAQDDRALEAPLHS